MTRVAPRLRVATRVAPALVHTVRATKRRAASAIAPAAVRATKRRAASAIAPAWVTTLTVVIALGCSRPSDSSVTAAGSASASATSSAAPATAATGSATAAAAASGSASAVPSTETMAPLHEATVGLAPAKACRAIEVKGTVSSADGKKIETGMPLDDPGWLDIGERSELVVKNVVTARELLFDGPARVFPCVANEEHFFLDQGTIVTTTAAGARPGAEVLIATPIGAVRYGDAKLRVKLDVHGLDVTADTGDAFVDLPTATGFGNRVHAGGHRTAPFRKTDAKELLGLCDAAAHTAEDRARDVLDPGPAQATPLGVRAEAHVKARQVARSLCAMARAALGTITAGASRDDLAAALDRADATWRGVPHETASRTP